MRRFFKFLFPLTILAVFAMLVFTAGQYIYDGSMSAAQPHYRRWWEVIACFTVLSLFIRAMEMEHEK